MTSPRHQVEAAIARLEVASSGERMYRKRSVNDLGHDLSVAREYAYARAITILCAECAGILRGEQ